MLLKSYKRIVAIKLLSLIAGTVLLGRYGRETNNSASLSLSSPATIIILDLSPSMNIGDMPWGVSRLDYAKDIIDQYSKTVSSPLGLIAFNERAELLVPPTEDYKIFSQKLSLLHTRSLQDIAVQWNKWDAYYEALDYALAKKDPTTSFVLISDFNSSESSSYVASYLSTLTNWSPFSIIALWWSEPTQMIDANGKTLPQQAVGRNDSIGKSFANALNSEYYINPEQLTPPLTRSLTTKNQYTWLLRVAALLLLLWL